MSEMFIHYIWQYQYYNKVDLLTTTGEPITVFFPGQRNSGSGPDFQNAKIRLGEMQWIGSVEIHVNASGWTQHHHDHDEAYNNVILHVVWNNDRPVVTKDGRVIPTLELRTRVDESLVGTYKDLLNSAEEVPCAAKLPSIKQIIIFSTIDRALSIRLENKSMEVRELLDQNRGDWEETAYQLLAKNFGFKVNAEPFFTLARMVPYKLLMKHNDRLLQMEAMLFGVAGFLEENEPYEYYKVLQREYNLLRRKYRLDHVMMNKAQWKFLRLRPANFPTFRIAQFAALLHYNKNLFSVVLNEGLEQLRQVLESPPSSFWRSHYNFSNESRLKDAHLGDASINNILINTVVPLYACYAKFKGEDVFMDKAFRFLYALPTEVNFVTRKWNGYGIKSRNAFDSQGLLELYNNFCSRHRCLDCNIGASLIKP